MTHSRRAAFGDRARIAVEAADEDEAGFRMLLPDTAGRLHEFHHALVGDHAADIGEGERFGDGGMRVPFVEIDADALELHGGQPSDAPAAKKNPRRPD